MSAKTAERDTIAVAWTLTAMLALGGCTESPDNDRSNGAPGNTPTIEVTSSAFSAGTDIPTRYTCDDVDVSPPLSWSLGPSGTITYALVMDDPDAPGATWVHWVIWNLTDFELTEDELFATGSPAVEEGVNSWGRVGYGGPCPPSGTHRYFFRVYALDTTLALTPGAGEPELLQAMDGHVLAEGELMGRYTRAR